MNAPAAWAHCNKGAMGTPIRCCDKPGGARARRLVGRHTVRGLTPSSSTVPVPIRRGTDTTRLPAPKSSRQAGGRGERVSVPKCEGEKGSDPLNKTYTTGLTSVPAYSSNGSPIVCSTPFRNAPRSWPGIQVRRPSPRTFLAARRPPSIQRARAGVPCRSSPDTPILRYRSHTLECRDSPIAS